MLYSSFSRSFGPRSHYCLWSSKCSNSTVGNTSCVWRGNVHREEMRRRKLPCHWVKPLLFAHSSSSNVGFEHSQQQWRNAVASEHMSSISALTSSCHCAHSAGRDAVRKPAAAQPTQPKDADSILMPWFRTRRELPIAAVSCDMMLLLR